MQEDAENCLKTYIKRSYPLQKIPIRDRINLARLYYSCLTQGFANTAREMLTFEDGRAFPVVVPTPNWLSGVK